MTYQEIADRLNQLEYRTSKGGEFKAITVRKLLERSAKWEVTNTVTKEKIKVGTKLTYTNKYNVVYNMTVTKTTEKSVWLDGFRNSWKTIEKYDVVKY